MSFPGKNGSATNGSDIASTGKSLVQVNRQSLQPIPCKETDKRFEKALQG
jgi:hypothetical protein